MGTYLSIDLDYWAMMPRGYNGKAYLNFIESIMEKDIPVKMVVSHEEILEHLEQKKPNHIINIDYHSDICADSEHSDHEIPFDEGTWAAFYSHRNQSIFEWRYPDREACLIKGYGRCDGEEYGGYKGKLPVETFGYNKVIYKKGLQGIDFSNIIEVCFVLSPNWCDVNFDVYNIFEIFDKLKVFEKKIARVLAKKIKDKIVV